MIKSFIITVALLFFSTIAIGETVPDDVINIILTHSGFTHFLHGRVPIKVTGLVSPNSKIIAHGKPINIVVKSSKEKDVVNFYSYIKNDTGYEVSFRYDIEGIYGKYLLRKSLEGNWVILKHSVFET